MSDFKAYWIAMVVMALICTAGILIENKIDASNGPRIIPAISTSQPIPVKYLCQPSGDKEIEEKLCSDLMREMAQSGRIQYNYDDAEPYVQIVVLPTEKNGYMAVSVVSMVYYPPLDGLMISVYVGSYIIVPGGTDDGTTVEYMSKAILGNTLQWLHDSADSEPSVGAVEA